MDKSRNLPKIPVLDYKTGPKEQYKFYESPKND
jgi:hypothetical protein